MNRHRLHNKLRYNTNRNHSRIWGVLDKVDAVHSVGLKTVGLGSRLNGIRDTMRAIGEYMQRTSRAAERRDRRTGRASL